MLPSPGLWDTASLFLKYPSDSSVQTNLATIMLLLKEFYGMCCLWDITHKLLKYYLKQDWQWGKVWGR